MKFKEIEVKFNAKNIKLSDFRKLMESVPDKQRWQEVASYDDYFVNDAGKFVRYRYNNEKGQLTTKEKTTDANNQNRIEYNLNLDNNRFETVQGFFEVLGFKSNFQIYKVCHIAWFSNIDIVYYIVYDSELKELDRFVEIEALEDYPWTSEQEAWDAVTKYEKLLEPLGITAQHRLKKSLFELYRK